ncbi:hypothetical protein [Dyadobacter luticola]|uniref:Lipocalin-like domain-containing protein n=1 Tax=Dyadobacter luticola TaxID=1979387 RepID=A0A5R9KPF1_9BACT|nr:hypothetical protein [Dyadobacter luticola]TLU97984.1 hypothetical protein FEN17_24660 [Dyadobacter luticola]
MKKSYSLIWCTLLALTLFVAGCKTKVKPVSERIAKAWTAESVKHGSTVVYTRGGSSNTTPAYSNFRLTLTNTSGTKTVSLTEFDGNTFTGTWDLNGDTKLVLSGLTPQPTGSGGTIEYTITSLEDAKVVLTRLTASPKTGGTINEYTLTNP